MTLCFKLLTDFIEMLSSESSGEWVESEKLPSGPIQLGYVNYSESVMSFLDALYTFSKAHKNCTGTNC